MFLHDKDVAQLGGLLLRTGLRRFVEAAFLFVIR
jgi:hypothetical protein